MWFAKKQKSNMTIPERKESQYFGQYSRVVDVDRLIQIFQESGKLAVESRNPETARSRYDLAIECYHQLMSLHISRGLQKSTKNAMEILVSRFPSQACMNEALGLCDKANKVKTIKTQYKHLKKAQQVLEKGLEKRDVGYENIMSIYVQVKDYVKKAEEQMKKT
jgi:hypothetical protein